MKVIIIGTGKVGKAILEHMSKEGHDLCIIDSNPKIIDDLVNRYDISGVSGNGASYETQKRAGVNKADVVITCTSSDEVNILACMVAKKIGAKNTIARIRNKDYYEQINFMKIDLGLSMIINPEQEAANEIVRILDFPQALKIDTFAKGKVNYEESDFLAGIKYALEVADRENKRMVINLTVGGRSTSGIEVSMLDSFEDLGGSGRIVVCGAGNEGNTDIHYSGNIQMADKSQDIIIQVGEQVNLDITLCPIGPDKIGAAIISPGGEMSYVINYTPEPFVYRGRFNLEDTSYEMRYIYPWIKSGNEMLDITLKNIKPGIWTLRIFPEFIINGNYNVYLPNKNLISPQTRFTDSSSDATITLFGVIKTVITVGAYNDRTDSLWIGSSKGPVVKRQIKPDIVAPGVDIIGPYQNDAYNTATGTGVSSSVVAGIVAIMMSYIISQEEESRNLLFSEPLKTFLMLGATRKEIYTYPNMAQGYGILNLRNILAAISNNIE